MIIAGTGHRPPKLGIGYDGASRVLLVDFVREHLSLIPGVDGVVSGMAQGFDQALAEAALDLEIPLTAAVPFLGMESRWPPDARRRYAAILGRTAVVHVVSPGGYSARKFAARDRWMVDRADVILALHDTGQVSGGTWITVCYAAECGKRIMNLWEEWVDASGRQDR